MREEVRFMSWVCDMCSTDNDDADEICFVCGARRSAESIKREREEKRAERLEKLRQIILNRGMLIMKIVFFSAGIVCLAMVIALIIYGIVVSRMDGFFKTTTDLLKRFGAVLSNVFLSSFPALFRRSGEVWPGVFESAAAFGSAAAHRFTSVFFVMFKGFFSRLGGHIALLFSRAIPEAAKRIWFGIGDILSSLSKVFSRIFGKIARLFG